MSYHDIFEYLTPLGLLVDHNSGALICRHEKCKRAIAVDGGQPSTHLASYHRIPIAARVELTRLLRKIILHNPEKLTPLEDGSSAHPSLRLYDGYICRKCGTRTADVQLIRKHDPQYGKGSCPAQNLGSSDHQSDDHIEYVYLQSWSVGKKRRYWIVEHEGSTTRAAGGKPVQQHINSVMRREAGRVQTKANFSTHEPSFAEESPWLDETDWVNRLKGRDLDVLSAMIEIPRRQAVQPHVLAHRGADSLENAVVSTLEDKRRIATLLSLVDPMMDRCEQTARSTSRNIMCWVRSIKPLTSSPKPFALVRRPGTTRKYRYLMKKLLAFVLRA